MRVLMGGRIAGGSRYSFQSIWWCALLGLIVFVYPIAEAVVESRLRSLPVSWFWAIWGYVYMPAGFIAGGFIGWVTYLVNRLVGFRFIRNDWAARAASALFGTGLFVAITVWWWSFGLAYEPDRALVTVSDFAIVVAGSTVLLFMLPPGRRRPGKQRDTDEIAAIAGRITLGDAGIDPGDGVAWLEGLTDGASNQPPGGSAQLSPQQSGVVNHTVKLAGPAAEPAVREHSNRWWRVGGVNGTLVLVSVLLGAVQGLVIGVVQGLIIAYPPGVDGGEYLPMILVLLAVAGMGIGAVAGTIVGVAVVLSRLVALSVTRGGQIAEWVSICVGVAAGAVVACVVMFSGLIYGNPWVVAAIITLIDAVVLLREARIRGQKSTDTIMV